MTSSSSNLVTPLPRRDQSTPSSGHMAEDALSSLRLELQKLSETVSDMTSQAAARVEKAATDGTNVVRANIVDRPWTSMGVAALAGALIAVAIIPKRTRGFRYNERASYNMDDIGASVRSAASRNGITQSLLSRLERVVDSIGSIDPAVVTASPAYDTAKTWMQSLYNSVRKP